jgi:hypothetical protein
MLMYSPRVDESRFELRANSAGVLMYSVKVDERSLGKAIDSSKLKLLDPKLVVSTSMIDKREDVGCENTVLVKSIPMITNDSKLAESAILAVDDDIPVGKSANEVCVSTCGPKEYLVEVAVASGVEGASSVDIVSLVEAELDSVAKDGGPVDIVSLLDVESKDVSLSFTLLWGVAALETIDVVSSPLVLELSSEIESNSRDEVPVVFISELV